MHQNSLSSASLIRFLEWLYNNVQCDQERHLRNFSQPVDRVMTVVHCRVYKNKGHKPYFLYEQNIPFSLLEYDTFDLLNTLTIKCYRWIN